MLKRILILLFVIILCRASLCVSADAVVDRAKVLYELGLLKGTGTAFSEEGIELERNANRAEMCTTVVRMLGKEPKAAYQKNAHPFSDVPDWASDNIGWLYENYLVNGVSATYFGATDIATVKQFSTMLLRVLGYDDSKGDFSYDEAVDVAISLGIAESSAKTRYELSRKDMISMCYNALRTNINNSSRLLIRKLCDEKAVSEIKAHTMGILKAPDVSDAFPNVSENLGEIDVAKISADEFCITLQRAVEEYGVRVAVLPEGGTVMQIPYSGNVYMEKGEISYSSGSAAGYVNKIYVHGLDTSKKYSFIVLKTSSEGEIYLTTGKSGVGRN